MLVVGVTYHNCGYLEGRTEKVFTEDLGSEGLWKAEDLHIPVYNTEGDVLFQVIDLSRMGISSYLLR
jgi:hypothetical protein